jgi:hypothetical protein
MRNTLLALGIALLSVAPFEPQPQRGQLPLFNLMEALAKPSEQQPPWIREAGAKLKQSKVPTWGDAMGLVTSAYPTAGTQSQESQDSFI